MSQEQPGFFAKAWAGVKGFASGIFGSLPRTLFYTMLIFAGSEAIGFATGWDPMGVAASQAAGGTGLLKSLAWSLGIGAAISGGTSAIQAISACSHTPLQAPCPPVSTSHNHAPAQQPSMSPTLPTNLPMNPPGGRPQQTR